MPIDPRIPLGIEAPQVASPMQTMQQVMAFQHQRAQQEYQQQRLAQEQQEYEAAQAKLAEEARQRAETRGIQQTFGGLPKVDRASVLKSLPPDVQMRAGAYLAGYDKLIAEADEAEGKASKSKLEVDAAIRKAMGQLGQGVAEFNYHPKAAELAFSTAAERYPEQVGRMWNWVQEAPGERLKPFIDQMIAQGTEEQEGVVVQPGQEIRSRVGGRLITTGPPATEKKANFQKEDFFVRQADGTLKFEAGHFDPDTGKRYVRGEDVSERVAVKPPRDPIDPNAVKPMTTNQRLDTTLQMQNAWERMIKPFRERQFQVAKIDQGLAALDRGNRNQATETLIITFEKMLDEISVVREAEYGRPGQMQSLEDRVKGALARMSGGGSSLTDVNLRDLAGVAKGIAGDLNNITSGYLADRRDAITETIKGTDITERAIFGPSRLGIRAPAAGGGAGAGTSAPGAGGVKVTAPNGRTYSFPSQQEADAFKKQAGIP